MDSFTLQPKVDDAQEFIEIALDFSNPLDLVREGISNAFDARATEIDLSFDVIQQYGEKILKIELDDNGFGMDKNGLESFFDLGNSLRRDDEEAIGEKGHGTKVYFNSNCIEVVTKKDGIKYHAKMNEPSKNLYDRVIPRVDVDSEPIEGDSSGTCITIMGYNNNRRDKFTHEQLKDYILWFTKFASVERQFSIEKNKDVILRLKGINKDEFETINFGHFFPQESPSVSKLFDEYIVDAPKYYCKRYVKTGSLKDMPEVKFQAVFYVEGNRIKYDYNPMIRRRGYSAPEGSYTIQERYGLWLCKDYIPVQRKNDWITTKGSEYTRFHAFVNCQDLKLTANRGSVDNTPSELLNDLRSMMREFYEEIIESDDWEQLDWLDTQINAYNTSEKEKRDFKHRIDRINRARIAEYNDVTLIEPQQESGVFTLYMQLSSMYESLFPFMVVDYDTHSGIDVIVKAKDSIPIKTSKLFYVEFKNYLTKDFNHSFVNLHSIICWDINLNVIRNNEEVIDIANEHRTLKIVPPENGDDYTRYYLDSLRSDRKIEVFVLKYYLKEKLGIDFLPRTEDSIV